jgi:hypothetical protein
MPVLRQHDVREPPRERVDHRHNLVAARNCQRAAGSIDSGAEVVLQVDDEQHVGGGVEHHV